MPNKLYIIANTGPLLPLRAPLFQAPNGCFERQHARVHFYGFHVTNGDPTCVLTFNERGDQLWQTPIFTIQRGFTIDSNNTNFGIHFFQRGEPIVKTYSESTFEPLAGGPQPAGSNITFTGDCAPGEHYSFAFTCKDVQIVAYRKAEINPLWNGPDFDSDNDSDVDDSDNDQQPNFYETDSGIEEEFV